MRSSTDRRRLAFAVGLALAGLLSAAAPAEAQLGRGPFSQGNMSLGLSGGGGSGTFNIGARVGYFVVEGLRLDAHFGYRWQSFRFGEGHFVEPGVGVRYYLWVFDLPVAIFPMVDLTLINLSASGTNSIDGNHTYGSVAPGGGLFIELMPRLGFEISAAALFHFEQDERVRVAGVAPDGPLLQWNFGLAFFF